MSRKKLKVGDSIEHTHPITGNVRIGKVKQILSAQFIYDTDSGNDYFCLFKEAWRPFTSKSK